MARLLRSLFVTALGTGPPIMRRNPAPILARIASPQTLPAGVGLAGGNGLQLHSSDPSSFSFNVGSGDGKAAWDREGGTRGRSMTVSFMLNADSVSLSSEGGEGKGGPYLKTAQKEGGIGGGVGGGYTRAELMGAIASAVAAVPTSSSSSDGRVTPPLALPAAGPTSGSSGGLVTQRTAKNPFRFSFRYSEQQRSHKDVRAPTPYDDLTYDSALMLADTEGLTIPVEDFVGVCIDHWEAECARLFGEIDRIATQGPRRIAICKLFDPSSIALSADEKVGLKKLAQWLAHPTTKGQYGHLFVDSTHWSTLRPLIVPVPSTEGMDEDQAAAAVAFAAAENEKNRLQALADGKKHRDRIIIDWDYWKLLLHQGQLVVPFEVSSSLLNKRTPAELTFLLEFTEFSREKRRVIDLLEEFVSSEEFLSGRLSDELVEGVAALEARARALVSGEFNGRYFAVPGDEEETEHSNNNNNNNNSHGNMNSSQKSVVSSIEKHNHDTTTTTTNNTAPGNNNNNNNNNNKGGQ